MSSLVNQFAQVFNLTPALLLTDFFEKRSEPDANGNPIYLAYSPIPNADPDDAVWFVYKIHYDGNGNFIQGQLPVNGVQFTYSYTLRATYFT